jgi:hypothetical protein
MASIDSPPYPLNASTASQVLDKLHDLRAWVEEMLPWLAENGVNIEVDLPKLPTLDAYRNMSVFFMAHDLRNLQNLREAWDGLVRTFEDVWGCNACIVAARSIVVSALKILRLAGMPFEGREHDLTRHHQSGVVGVVLTPVEPPDAGDGDVPPGPNP